MDTRITKTVPVGELLPEGAPIPVGMTWDFEVTIEAVGHKREDGLTAAEVRAELERKEELHGS